MSVSGPDIEIIVREGPEILETRRCRTMLMPDGRAGAVWRGLVYPVGESNHIDIDGEAFPLITCIGGTEAPPAGTDFASIQGADEAYVVLAGPVAVREEAAARLQAAGVAVLRVGRYLGDPVDGFAADWFIRFEKPVSDESLDDLLVRVLGRRRAQTETEPETASDARIRLLREELARARSREAALRSELAGARTVAKPTTGTDPTDALFSELAEEQHLRHEAESGKAIAEEMLAAACAELEKAHSTPAVARQALPRTRLQDEIADVLGCLLPNLNLLRDSLTVAASEYGSRKALYRSLAELASVNGRLRPNWKAVQGASRWWERHVSDGQDNTGRLYAQYVSETRRWHVLISDKAEQPRDMAWLRRHFTG
jgi:hypothetical protein